ncbi:MAG: esterase/lipase family protein [Bacteroidota bacterium]
MQFILKNKKNRNLLILVHGLNGSEETWMGNQFRFVENLSKEDLIKDNFDLALFTYGTKILEINWLAKFLRLVRGFLSNKPKEDSTKFNVGIDKVSRPLVGELNGIHQKYETISFVSHSMGGLVTKSVLTWLNGQILDKIYFFLSLSVPHIGAHLATIGSKLPVLGKNPQIIGLQAMSEFTTTLNQRFGSLNPKPKIVYQYGIYDKVVPEASAYPPNVPNDLTVATGDDHSSVLLIKNSESNTIYNRLLDELYIVTLPFIALDVGIPEGVTFKFFIETIVSRLKNVTINFDGFSKKELSSRLKSGSITSTDFRDILIKVGSFSLSRLPEYTIIQERGTLNFTLKAK